MNEGTKGGRWCVVARRKKDRKEKVELSFSLDGGHRENTRGDEEQGRGGTAATVRRVYSVGCGS